MLKKDEYDNVYVCGAALIGETNINTNMMNVCGAALVGRTNMTNTNTTNTTMSMSMTYTMS